MERAERPNHGALYRIAEQQAGYFTTAQALSAGFSRPLLAHHVRRGRYQRVQPGLHRLVQFPHSLYEDLVIAQLGVGPQSVISHDSALAVYQLSDVTPVEIHITAPRSTSRRRRGIRLHTQRLAEDEITFYEGLRLTTVERTIADMAACGLADEQIALAIREAVARGLTTRRRLAEQASRRKGRARRLIFSPSATILLRTMKSTRYFEEQVLVKRPYIKREWCELALRRPILKQAQPDGRIRHWVYIEERGWYLRVVTLEDGETIHNAFPDRNFGRNI